MSLFVGVRVCVFFFCKRERMHCTIEFFFSFNFLKEGLLRIEEGVFFQDGAVDFGSGLWCF